MLVDMIGMLAAGVGALALVFAASHALRKARGRRMAGWALPAAAGVAMIAFSVWNEYTWFSRVTARLPPSVEVVLPVTESAPWRPWSYVWPMTARFIAIDHGATRRAVDRPSLLRTEAMLVARWMPTSRVPLAFDCANGRRADLIGGAQIAADGTLTGGDWVTLPPEDPMLKAACREG